MSSSLDIFLSDLLRNHHPDDVRLVDDNAKLPVFPPDPSKSSQQQQQQQRIPRRTFLLPATAKNEDAHHEARNSSDDSFIRQNHHSLGGRIIYTKSRSPKETWTRISS
jgi:hypothetical protein